MTRRLHEYPELQASARERQPRLALILGSGLNDVADRLEDAAELPFTHVPGLETAGVPGHRGAVVLGTWAGVPVLAFAGRLHYYEGHPWRRIVQPIHLAHGLGASILLATNAAGGIHEDLQPGDLMAIHAHVDWTRPHGWREPAKQLFYSERLLRLLQQAAAESAMVVKTGSYAQLTGPCYETPAEIRALKACSADAVGMSTGREIQTGHELGMECAAISCITNKAAGLGGGTIHHQEVIERGRQSKDRLTRLLEKWVPLAA
jgi:purine-nucleoside phosphorylase